MKVLIVDDHKQVGSILQREFCRVGYEAEWKISGEEVLGMDLRGIDLVLVDWIMCETDGMTLAYGLREKGYEGEIVLMSNYDLTPLEKRAKQIGAYCLKKDIGLLEMILNVDSILKGKGPYQVDS